jgi:hypothetical protein
MINLCFATKSNVNDKKVDEQKCYQFTVYNEKRALYNSILKKLSATSTCLASYLVTILLFFIFYICQIKEKLNLSMNGLHSLVYPLVCIYYL